MNYSQKAASHSDKISLTGLRDRVQEMIQSLSAGNPAMASVYFRKFEEASDEDLESLLGDLSLLDEIARDDVKN